ncbi:MAG: ribosomal protein L7/L12 [Flavobacteriaceae bacterium]|nr:ribosomal protein L7/L12 [Flavobacteriaceae bacterium]
MYFDHDKKIQAIKAYRALTGSGLKESKEFMDEAFSDESKKYVEFTCDPEYFNPERYRIDKSLFIEGHATVYENCNPQELGRLYQLSSKQDIRAICDIELIDYTRSDVAKFYKNDPAAIVFLRHKGVFK